jgi:hypothetical protein
MSNSTFDSDLAYVTETLRLSNYRYSVASDFGIYSPKVLCDRHAYTRRHDLKRTVKTRAAICRPVKAPCEDCQ